MNLSRTLRALRIRTFPPEPKPLILMYHRVADEPLDPWGNAVSPVHFSEHLAVLRSRRNIVSLADFTAMLRAGTLPKNSVAVTFDDGYVDNLLAAKPQLAAADAPATVFLATGYLGQSGEFWWDELTGLILNTPGRRSLKVTIRGNTIQFDLDDEHRPPSRGWRAWLEPPRTAREKAYLCLWKAGRSLSIAERERLMQDLRQAYADCKIPAGGTRPMTAEEVRSLISDKLISIGAHSVTHPALTELRAEARQFEIVNSKRACEVLSAEQVSAFAYPFGSVDATVRKDISEAGFVCACSTRYGTVEIDSDLFVLPRVHVVDCDGEAFERSLHYAALTPVSERDAF